MFTKAAAPVGENNVKPLRTIPFVLPQDKENKAIEFVVGLKRDAPFEYCTIGGINFEKYVLPNEASLMKNIGKIFMPNRVLRLLTQKQSESLWEEAKKRDIFIPKTRNPKFNPDDRENIEPQFVSEKIVKAGDWIILEPAHSFNEAKYSLAEGRTFQSFEFSDGTKQDLTDAQRTVKKGNK